MQYLSQRIESYRRLRGTAGLVLIALALATALPAKSQTIPSDAQATCTVSAPVFASWFASGNVSVNGAVKPANSVTFPNVPNCSFYQWAMQMFLWLTSPASSPFAGGDRIFDTAAFFDVSPRDDQGRRTFLEHKQNQIRNFSVRNAQLGANRLPVIVDTSGGMYEVQSPQIGQTGRPLVLDQAGKAVEYQRATTANGKLDFLDPAGKTIAQAKPALSPHIANTQIAQQFNVGDNPIFLDAAGNVINTEIGQAGGNQVLLAQNGSLVYYVTMVNDVFAYFLTGTKNGGITPAPTQFPTTQAELDKITAFASAHGKTFTEPNALAVEIKASWIEAAGLPNLNDYITMTATVPTFKKMTNPEKWVPDGEKTVQLALVGIHVVGSTAGHPEMIWATFEHFGVAPNAPYSYNSTTGPKAVPQDTSGTWLFAKSSSTGPFNQPHMKADLNNNIVPVPNQTISPSDTLRMKPWGSASNASPNPLDATAAASNTEIISIHNSVNSMMPNGDVRKNYFMTGATWTIGGTPPNGNFGQPGNTGGNVVGTSQLNNTTMETYQQGNLTFDSNLPKGANCFFCHVTNTTSVSHIFGNANNGLKPLFP